MSCQIRIRVVSRIARSRWYNENACCDYHSGNRGHSTEDCTALKWRVHDLIKAGALAFDDEDVPDVYRNPLPDHQKPKINVIENVLELQIEKDVKTVCMPMETAYKALLRAGMLEEEQEKKVKMKKGSIFNTTRGPWATPFKTVKIF